MTYSLYVFTFLLFFPLLSLSQNHEEKVISYIEEICLNRPNKRNPPVSLKQLVYQSVKAPQIEPIEEQDKDKEVFNNYDLLRDKPAGLIVEIEKSSWAKDLRRRFNLNETLALLDVNFSLSLKVNGVLYDEILCSEKLSSRDVEYNPDPFLRGEELDIETKAEYCKLNWLKFGYLSTYKFIPLPTESYDLLGQYLGSVNIQIVSELEYKGKTIKPCSSSTSFKVNMLQPKKFKVLLTGIYGEIKNDKGDDICKLGITDLHQLEKIFKSDEVRKDFFNMFPVSNRAGKKPSFNLTIKNGQYVYQTATCGNSKKENLFSDVINLNRLRKEYGGQRIIAIVPRKYVAHYKGSTTKSGFMRYMTPVRKIPFSDFFLDSRPSYQVAFIREDEVNAGTLLHELAHTFGQGKEFYESQSFVDETTYATPYYYCAQFTSLGKKPEDREPHEDFIFYDVEFIIGTPCPEYRITGGVFRTLNVTPTRLSKEPRRQVWKLLNNQESFMGNSKQIQRRGYQQWIDRDTYQKTLKIMTGNLEISEEGLEQMDKKTADKIREKQKKLIDCSVGKRPVISISGIYERREDEGYLTDFSAEVSKVEDASRFFFGEQFSIGKEEEEGDYLSFQLKKANKLIEEIVFPRVSYTEIFYEDGSIERQEEKSFPLFASFCPLCNPFREGDYEVSVVEVYKEEGIRKEEILVDSLPVKWENKE